MVIVLSLSECGIINRLCKKILEHELRTYLRKQNKKYACYKIIHQIFIAVTDWFQVINLLKKEVTAN